MAALIARNDPVTLFARGGALTRVITDERGQPVAAAHTADSLRNELSRVADWYELVGGVMGVRQKDAYPPTDAARAALALGEWSGVPALAGITQSPILHADGSVHDTTGYDPLSARWYAPAAGFTLPPIPDRLTPDDVRAAVAVIDDIIADFPFVGAADRAAAFSAILTAALRPLIDGPTPLHLIDKPRAGSGASLLAEVIALIATGAPAQMKTLANDRNGEETRKAITAALLAGSPLIVLDNIDSALASGHLAAAITARIWEDRLLGRSEMVRLPVSVTWLATGNNIRVRGDIARRSLVTRLDARVERPWERTGFRHPHLLAYVAEQRGAIVAAIVTLARGWIQAGRPAGTSPTLGSFEAWSHVVGGILTWGGVPGLLGNLADFYVTADEEYGEWAAFIGALGEWSAGKPFAVADLVRALGDEQSVVTLTAPAVIVAALGKTTLPVVIGRAFAAKADVRYSGERLVKAGIAHHAALWRVARDDERASGEVGEVGEVEVHADAGEKSVARIRSKQPPQPPPPPRCSNGCGRPRLGQRADGLCLRCAADQERPP